jgi:hypothetical protein
MSEKIFDLLFTLPRGGTRLTIHAHLLVISVAKASPSLPRSTAIIRIPKAISPVNPRLCPTPLLCRERSLQLDATGSDLPKNRIILSALDSRRLARHAKPALVDFMMAKFDRFAD